MPPLTFDGVVFMLDQYSIEDLQAQELLSVLRQNGGKREFSLSKKVTHVISNARMSRKELERDDMPPPKLVSVGKLVVVPVTECKQPQWVEACMSSGSLVPTNLYSLRPRIFDKVVVSMFGISLEDQVILRAILEYHGAKLCDHEAGCTHVLLGTVDSIPTRCPRIRKHRPTYFLNPHWVTDSAGLGHDKKVFKRSEKLYTFDQPAKSSKASSVRAKKQTPVQPKPRSMLAPPKEDLEVSSANLGTFGPVRELEPTPQSGLVRASLHEEGDASVPMEASDRSMSPTGSQASSLASSNASPTGKRKRGRGRKAKSRCGADTFRGLAFYIDSEYEKSKPNKKWREYLTRVRVRVSFGVSVTHYLCSSRESEFYTVATDKGICALTPYWLTKVVAEQKWVEPIHPIYRPRPRLNKLADCSQWLVSVTGFEGPERTYLRDMLEFLGVRYTGYFTQHHTHLIARTTAGAKYRRALDWGVITVNEQFVFDMYTQWAPVNAALPVYKVSDGRRSASASPSPTKQQPVPEPKRRRIETKPRICMTGFVGREKKALLQVQEYSYLVTHGSKAIEALGGQLAKAEECTHLICKKPTRTIKFLCALSVCQYLVNADWLQDSQARGVFLPEQVYIMKANTIFEVGVFEPRASLARAAEASHKFLEGCQFYITPKVEPSRETLERIVRAAGGSVLNQAPSPRLVKGKTFVVASQADMGIAKTYIDKGVPVHNAELILCGALHQHLEPKKWHITVDQHGSIN